MLRSVVAVVVGVIVGVMIIGVIEWAGHQVFPAPEGIDFNNAAQVESYMQQLPTGALGFVLVAWFFGACDGAMLTAWQAPARPWLHALIVVTLLALAASSMLLMLPHPGWFVTATPLVFVSAWLIGGKIGCMLHDRRRSGVSR